MRIRTTERLRSLWQDLASVPGYLTHLTGALTAPFQPTFPTLNIYENDESALVVAAVPGVTIEDIDLTVLGTSLTLAGRRPAENKDASYHRQERAIGSFKRTIDLRFEIHREDVAAELNEGILFIKLPRAAVSRPRTIPVQAG